MRMYILPLAVCGMKVYVHSFMNSGGAKCNVTNSGRGLLQCHYYSVWCDDVASLAECGVLV